MPKLSTDCTYDCAAINVDVTYDGSTDWNGGPAVRVAEGSDENGATLYAAIYNAGAGQIIVRKWLSTPLSEPGEPLLTVTVTLVEDDVFTLGISLGNLMTVYVNDVSQGTVLDGSIASTNLCVGSVNLK